MKRATATGLATVPAALVGAGWHALAALVLGVLIVAATVCWAIADPGRGRRLAILIHAWRGAVAPARPTLARQQGRATRKTGR